MRGRSGRCVSRPIVKRAEADDPAGVAQHQGNEIASVRRFALGIGRTITPSYLRPVFAVLTREVETPVARAQSPQAGSA